MMDAIILRQKLANYLAVDPDFRAAYDYTHQRFEAAKNLTGHNWEHIYRDTINAIVIGEAEDADMGIVLPAMVMHDIGFLYGAIGKTHATLGADNLSEYLGAGNIQLPHAKLERIRDCIRTHKGDMHGEAPESLEAKVVSDADMLEKFGPVGVYQSIRTFAEFNYAPSRIIRNLTVMEDWTLQTKTGDAMATDGKKFASEFGRTLAKAYEPYEEEAS
jgi:HD superfamily phosphodiesterase